MLVFVLMSRSIYMTFEIIPRGESILAEIYGKSL